MICEMTLNEFKKEKVESKAKNEEIKLTLKEIKSYILQN